MLLSIINEIISDVCLLDAAGNLNHISFLLMCYLQVINYNMTSTSVQKINIA